MARPIEGKMPIIETPVQENTLSGRKRLFFLNFGVEPSCRFREKRTSIPKTDVSDFAFFSKTTKRIEIKRRI